MVTACILSRISVLSSVPTLQEGVGCPMLGPSESGFAVPTFCSVPFRDREELILAR